MKHYFLSLFLVLSDPQVAPIPDLIAYADPRYKTPMWVSVDRAFRSDGEVNSGLFDIRGLRQIEGHLRPAQTGTTTPATGADPCDTFSSVASEHRIQPNATLEDLSKFSLGIYRGTIEQVLAGFLNGQPGSLLSVRVERSLKNLATLSGKRMLVYYPYARAPIGPYRLCKTDPRFPHRPSVGDSVFLFAYREPSDELQRIVAPQSREIAFESREGKVTLGAGLSLEGIKSLDDLEAAVNGRR